MVEMKKVWAMYFSPTGGTEKAVKTTAEALADKNIKVINAGRKGDKTPLALMRLESVLFKQKFDALSIFLGVNDAIIGRGRWADEPGSIYEHVND